VGTLLDARGRLARGRCRLHPARWPPSRTRGRLSAWTAGPRWTGR